jgi:hypothetical protein
LGQPKGDRRAALGELISYERQRRGYSRREQAGFVRRVDRTLGTDQGTVKRWEVYSQLPQPAALRALAVVMERPIDELTALVRQQADWPRDGELPIETYWLASGALDWRLLLPDIALFDGPAGRLYATRAAG